VTSFHWLDPLIRVQKSAETLHSNGTLVVISTHHIAGNSSSFFTSVQLLYEKFMPGTLPGQSLPAAN
jgi:hypothetical protein